MLREIIGRRLARFLSQPRDTDLRPATSRPEVLKQTLRKGDVLLVEGSSRIGTAIKHLTQSTWTHAALYIGDTLKSEAQADEPRVLVEADLVKGVRAVPLSTYAHYHTRICRPIGLSEEERKTLIDFAIARIGHQYDLRNIIDLARYVIRTPPVPDRWKRNLLTLGSGDPTKAICSTLIAQAFQSIRYPILPQIIEEKMDDPACTHCYREILQIRHHSLFAPKDFDVSPYFEIIKPTLLQGFDFHQLSWDGLP